MTTTCDDLRKDADSLQNRLNQANNQFSKYEWPGATSVGTLAKVAELRGLTSEFNGIAKDAQEIINESNALGCQTSVARIAQLGLRDARESIKEVNSKISFFEIRAEEQKKRETQTQESVTRENNSGTGTPGTAGEGKDATPSASERAADSQPPSVQLSDEEILSRQQSAANLSDEEILARQGTQPQPVELSDEEILARRQATGLSDEEIIARQSTADGGEMVITAKREQKQIPPPPAPKDWRVRISLAPGSNYLYNYGDAALRDAGILEPLRDTGGVIFPYTPSISVAYNAKYDTQTITHSNYNIHNYTGSSVDQIQITGDFTAQDTTEAAYMLAVIHFFRSATKMFYGGEDKNPIRGTPPPLLYLSGHGNYQFDNHPMVLTNFSYSLPVDVDYINAYPDGADAVNSIPLAPFQSPNTAKPTVLASGIQRLTGSGLRPGGMCRRPVFQNRPAGADVVTRVPTKISIQLSFLPIVTRNAITNKFSLKEYATGKLLRGSKNPGTGGGLW